MPGEDKDISNAGQSGMSNLKSHCSRSITVNSFIPSLRQPLPISSLNHPAPIPPYNPHSSVPSSNPPPSITHSNLPIRFSPSNPHPQIHPSIHPISAPLSIPIPPPGFHLLPPHIPPPLTILGPPPTMAAPPSILHPVYPYPLNTLHTVHMGAASVDLKLLFTFCIADSIFKPPTLFLLTLPKGGGGKQALQVFYNG